jgi:hypothetical protein
VGEGAIDGGSVKCASQIRKMGCKVKESWTKSKGKGKEQSDGDSLIERSGGSMGRARGSKRWGCQRLIQLWLRSRLKHKCFRS